MSKTKRPPLYGVSSGPLCWWLVVSVLLLFFQLIDCVFRSKSCAGLGIGIGFGLEGCRKALFSRSGVFVKDGRALVLAASKRL